ncbi:MAG: IclR family transcriptional regulator [Comamonadaceae bacterium]|nr:IclR family transcriptional regulator [Comamonadaceae bacterium]
MDSRGITRIMEVLRLVASSQEEGLRASEVARETGLGYTTARRILQGLLREGAVEAARDGKRYCIGPAISMMGLARVGHLSLRAIALDAMMRLQSISGETCFLTVRSDLDSVCIHRETGTHARKVLSINVGSRRPMGVVIGSVAYLAALPRRDADAIVDANALRYSRYQLDVPEVRLRIERARRAGFAYTDRGLRPGTRSVGTVVLNRLAQPVAAISIVTVADRLPVERRRILASELAREAAALGAHIR